MLKTCPLLSLAEWQISNGGASIVHVLGHDNNGRVKRQAIYGKTTDEVKQKITELEMEILNGRYVGMHNVTVEIYISKWLEKHKKDLKPTTFSRYHDLIEKHIVPILGNTKLQGVTKA